MTTKNRKYFYIATILLTTIMGLFFHQACSLTAGESQAVFSSTTQTLTLPSALIVEEGQDAVVRLSRPVATNKSVTISFETLDGTATSADYVFNSGSVPMDPMSDHVDVIIKTRADEIYEETENFTFRINTVDGALGSGLTLNIQILNKTPMPQLTVEDAMASEGGLVAVLVKLDRPSTLPVSFKYSTVNNTAIAGQDFVAKNMADGYIPALQLDTTLTLSVLSDEVSDPGETFNVVLSNPTNAGILREQGAVTINNLTALPKLTITDATLNEGSTLLASSASAVKISMDRYSNSPVRFSYRTIARSASISDFTSLPITQAEIPVGQLEYKIPAITVSSDVIYEPTEQFDIEIIEPVNAELLKNIGVVSITNTSLPPTISIADVTLNENGTTTVLVQATGQTTLNMTVSYLASAVQAKSNVDYSHISGQLIIDANIKQATIQVDARADELVECDETYKILLSAPTNATFSDSEGIVTIKDFNPPIKSAIGLFNSACILLANKTVKCWGTNIAPFVVPGLTNIVDIWMGSTWGYALSCSGNVTKFPVATSTTLTNTNLTNVQSASISDFDCYASFSRSCVNLTDGTANCSYKTGNPVKDNSSGATITNIIDVKASAIDTSAPGIGEYLLLVADGRVYTKNGNNITATGARVLPGVTNATGIAGGPFHACMTLSTGEVKCVGKNTHGQIGNNTTTDYSIAQLVSGITTAKEVAVTDGQWCDPQDATTSSCALLSDGKVRCWGFGYGLVPVELSMPALRKLGKNQYDRYIGTTASGAVYIWGPNSAPQLVTGVP